MKLQASEGEIIFVRETSAITCNSLPLRSSLPWKIFWMQSSSFIRVSSPPFLRTRHEYVLNEANHYQSMTTSQTVKLHLGCPGRAFETRTWPYKISTNTTNSMIPMQASITTYPTAGIIGIVEVQTHKGTCIHCRIPSSSNKSCSHNP